MNSGHWSADGHKASPTETDHVQYDTFRSELRGNKMEKVVVKGGQTAAVGVTQGAFITASNHKLQS